CDLRARGPHLRELTPELRDALVDGLGDGSIEPGLWRRCMDGAVASVSPDDSAWLFDLALHAYRRMLDDEQLATDPLRVERVATIQQFYLDRRPELDGHRSFIAGLVADLRHALAHHELSPIAGSFADELVATTDVEHGTWHGQAIDVALMDALAADG